MFQVMDKRDYKLYTVYDVSYYCTGEPMFLIYKNGVWEREEARYFAPNFIETLDGYREYTDE